LILIEILVGLNVIDTESYKFYRDGMIPLLTAVGGYFKYDFTIDETLKSDTNSKINRLFLICFPSHTIKESFFNDEAYLAIKSTYFESAVANTTIIAEYET